jgi:hypothetical protein
MPFHCDRKRVGDAARIDQRAVDIARYCDSEPVVVGMVHQVGLAAAH